MSAGVLVSRIRNNERRSGSREVFCTRKLVLADSICDPAIAWVRLCSRIFGRSRTARSLDWRARIDFGQRFSAPRANATRLAKRRHAANPDALLVWDLRPRTVNFLRDRIRAVARCAWRVCERDPADRSLGDVHVD